MNTQTLETLDYDYEHETLDDIAEFDDILAHPENHRGYNTAADMLKDMGSI